MSLRWIWAGGPEGGGFDRDRRFDATRGMELLPAIFSLASRTIKKQTRFFVRIGVISTSYAEWACVVWGSCGSDGGTGLYRRRKRGKEAV